MLQNSPLRFLDYDVSRYLYEKYYPSNEIRTLKKEINIEYLDNVKKYIEKYQLNNFHENQIMFCIRGCLYKRVYFSSFLREYNMNKQKIIKAYIHKDSITKGYERALEYKNEALHLKKVVNRIQ